VKAPDRTAAVNSDESVITQIQPAMVDIARRVLPAASAP
jgi:hypothetical protein